MKKLLISLFSLALTFSSAQAIDSQSLEILKQQGFQVKMGEFTGAGSKLSIQKLAGLIHPQGIIMKADCKSIVLKSTTDQSNPKISDISHVIVDQSKLNAADFEGFFTAQ